MTPCSHKSPIEQGQHLDYGLGFLEVSFKVVVTILVMILMILLEKF